MMQPSDAATFHLELVSLYRQAAELTANVTCGPECNECCSRHPVWFTVPELLAARLAHPTFTNQSNGCAFKTAKGCAVYEQRPLMCRLYGVHYEGADGLPLQPFGVMGQKNLPSHFLVAGACPWSKTRGTSTDMRQVVHILETYAKWINIVGGLWVGRDNSKAKHRSYREFNATSGAPVGLLLDGCVEEFVAAVKKATEEAK